MWKPQVDIRRLPSIIHHRFETGPFTESGARDLARLGGQRALGILLACQGF